MEYTTSQAIADSLVIYSIVIVVSLLVAVVIRLIVWTLSRKAAQVTAKAAAAPKPAAVPAVATAHGMPQDHFAAIAAAVAAMMGAHRIVRIETAGQGYTWTSAARTAHHMSRAPRR
jgi:flagellar biosynthesis/type III secretory pathway M-ring protein FliF/YscJ